MFNNRLRCQEIDSTETESESGFSMSDSDKRFKRVKIVDSSEEDMQTGEIALVSVNAGEKDPDNEDMVIIHRQDVIWIEI